MPPPHKKNVFFDKKNVSWKKKWRKKKSSDKYAQFFFHSLERKKFSKFFLTFQKIKFFTHISFRLKTVWLRVDSDRSERDHYEETIRIWKSKVIIDLNHDMVESNFQVRALSQLRICRLPSPQKWPSWHKRCAMS